jgi:Domain of unknown function (DUF4105)
MKKKLLLIVFLYSTAALFSQNPVLSANAKVSVFTCGKGAELYSTFGHTAIRIQDSINTLDVVYNYGAFDFKTENFYLKFVKGDLQYFMIATSYEEFIYEYQYDNRDVIEQTLDFTQPQKQQLFERLNASLLSEDKSYTYKFIDKNCTTMVADKIDETLGKPIIQKVDDKSISYRTVLYPYFEDHFWYKFGINIIFGERTDRKAEQLFLPIELLNSLDKLKNKGQPLVIEKTTVVKGNDFKAPFSFFNSIYCVVLVVLLIVISNKKEVFVTYLFILGLLGLFLSLVGLYSLHREVLWNYNVLLFNPIYLALPFLNQNWKKKAIVFCGILLLVYIVVMLSKPHLILMLPFIISVGFILRKLFLLSAKK